MRCAAPPCLGPHAAAAAAQRACGRVSLAQTHAFIVQTLDRTLCSPVPPANVSAWDARPLNTHVQPEAFERALAAAACTRGQQQAGASSPGRPVVTLTVPNPPATQPFDYTALRSAVIGNGASAR